MLAVVKNRIPNLLQPLLGLLLSVVTLSVGAVTVTDSRGDQTFSAPPQRVVALSWSAAENLLELGVRPVAIADTAGYRAWVKNPTLPADMADVGPRHQPNLEAIAHHHPDLIILEGDQPSLVHKLQLIAPVLEFDSFRADHNNLVKARQTFLQLAKLFNKEQAAQKKLRQQQQELAQLKQRIRNHFNGQVPPVTVIRLTDLTHSYVFDSNSFVTYALDALDIDTPVDLPPSKWGAHAQPLISLADCKTAVLYIEPFPMKEQLFKLPLWQAMPFIRHHAFASIEPSWTYGGISSRLYLARSITEALLSLPANTQANLNAEKEIAR